MALSKKTSVLVFGSTAAAITGIAAVVAIARWRRTLSESHVATRLRDVQEVLTDCYRKISEIEDHLPDLLQSSADASPRPKSRRVTNSRRAVGA